MAASQQNPTYTVYIISETTKYNVTPALLSIDRSESDGQIAQRVNFEFRNVQVNNVWISSIFQAANRVFVYANDGTKNDEVFRGFLWERSYKSSMSDQVLKISAYDHLIYLQESEDSYYFSPRKGTDEIVKQICNNWNIKLEYTYNSMANRKIAARGKLYDILTADILDYTAWHTGDKYVIISEKDVMKIKLAGSNETVYHFIAGKNVESTTSGWTMDGVITQVLIIGKANEDGYEPIELAVPRNKDKYGTLQKILRRDEETELWQARGDATTILNESSEPKWEYTIAGPDIPWIRKGDKIIVDAGDINEKNLVVTAISRASDLKKSKMTITAEKLTKVTQAGMLDWW